MPPIVHLAIDLAESEEVFCGSADWEEAATALPEKVSCPRCLSAASAKSLALYGMDVLA